MKDAIGKFIGLSKEARHALDRVRDPMVKLTYPKDELPHELMVSGLICRNSNDRWLLSPRGLSVLTEAKISDNVTAQYYSMPGVCRRILKSMLDGHVNADPYIPLQLRNSGFIKETDAGWVVTELFKQVKEV
jgi:hypothetical protein